MDGAEAYSIPLIQLLKLCGLYISPAAQVTAELPPVNIATGKPGVGHTRFGFALGRAASLLDFPGNGGGVREAIWRRRLDRMEGLVGSVAAATAADDAPGSSQAPDSFGIIFRGALLDEPLLGDALVAEHGAALKSHQEYRGLVGSLPEDPGQGACWEGFRGFRVQG